MTGNSTLIDEFWGASEASGDVLARDASFVLVVDSTVDESRRVSIVRRADGHTTATVSPAIARLLRLQDAPEPSEALLLEALAAAGVELHEPDNLYYLGLAARAEIVAEEGPAHVRALGAGDAAAFAVFEAAASEQDRDDAFVELDHWAVVGAFEGDLLVAAASAYPWGGATLADIGVLTLPDYRGRGHARSIVRALSREAIARGFEPQYRCQEGNAGSIAVADSAGFVRYGTWQVVSEDSPV